MTQEDKELLLKDICGRIPYDVKCKIEMWVGCDVCTVYNINSIGRIEIVEYCDTNGINIERIKPYLFPLSSMTEEQKQFFNNLPIGIDKYGDISTKDDLSGNSLYTDLEIYLEVIDWLNKNHFDYRGLIEKGFAIDATNLNIY